MSKMIQFFEILSINFIKCGIYAVSLTLRFAYFAVAMFFFETRGVFSVSDLSAVYIFFVNSALFSVCFFFCPHSHFW